MTQAVCIVCGANKLGAWTPCLQCRFQPITGFELVLALAFSDNGGYRSQLSILPAFVRQQIAALEGTGAPFSFDEGWIPLIEGAFKNPEFRDMLTLRRAAKDGLFSKYLNMHEIGPDGYKSHILKRGRDIDTMAFDAARTIGDGDLYIVVSYQAGDHESSAVPKDKWYAMYDLTILVERDAYPSLSKLQRVYEGLNRDFIEKYLKYGTIVPSGSTSE